MPYTAAPTRRPDVSWTVRPHAWREGAERLTPHVDGEIAVIRDFESFAAAAFGEAETRRRRDRAAAADPGTPFTEAVTAIDRLVEED